MALFVGSLVLYLPAVATDFVINDSHAAAATAWRLAVTGAPWVDGIDTSELEGTELHSTWIVEGAGGHSVYNRTAGTVLSGVPAYFALNPQKDPSDFRIWVGGVAAAVWTAGAGVALFLALRFAVTDTAALGSTAAFLVASPAWSVSADALWTHNVTLTAVACAMFFTTRRRWALVGLAFAVGILARPHIAVIAAVVGLYLSWKRRDWRLIPTVGLTSGLGLIALSLWNRSVFGTWSLRGGYSPYVTENLVAGPQDGPLYQLANFLGFFLAPDRGFFVWTPVVLLLLGPLLQHWRSTPDWMRAFTIAGLLYTVVQLRINAFPGGSGFYGYRHGLELLICLLPALAFSFRWAGQWRRVSIGALLGLQGAVIAVGAFGESYVLPEREVWTNNAFLGALLDRPVEFGVLISLATVGGGVVAYVAQRGSRGGRAALVPGAPVGAKT